MAITERFDGEKFDYRKFLTCVQWVDVYRNDVVLKRESTLKKRTGMKGEQANKKKIHELSSKSLKALAFVASNTSVDFGIMVTLTYPHKFEKDGKQAKYHLKKMIKRMVERFKCSYLWFLEFQKRDAAHFHVLLSIQWYIPSDIYWVKKSWFDIVGSGDPDHLESGTRIEKIEKKDGAKFYAIKYAMKPYQKIVPASYSNVGRFWGHSKDVKPKKIMSIQTRSTEDAVDVLGNWMYKDKILTSCFKVAFNASKHIEGIDDYRHS